jgi:hypothetical protein
MDATLYIQRLKEEISMLREEKMLIAELNDIDVIEAIEVPNTFSKKKEEVKEEKRKLHYVEWNGETWVWAK